MDAELVGVAAGRCRSARCPVCDGYDPTVAFSGTLDRLVVAADGGASFADLGHQVETAFRSQ